MVRNIEQKTQHTACATPAEKQVETKDIHTRHRLIKQANRQGRCVRDQAVRWSNDRFFFLDRSKSCRDHFSSIGTSGTFDDESNLRVNFLLTSLVSMSLRRLRSRASPILFLDASFHQQYTKETCFEIWSSKVHHTLACTRGHCNRRICNWSRTTELTYSEYNHISTTLVHTRFGWILSHKIWMDFFLSPHIVGFLFYHKPCQPQRINKVGVSFQTTPMGKITYTHSPRTGVDSSKTYPRVRIFACGPKTGTRSKCLQTPWGVTLTMEPNHPRRLQEAVGFFFLPRQTNKYPRVLHTRV